MMEYLPHVFGRTIAFARRIFKRLKISCVPRQHDNRKRLQPTAVVRNLRSTATKIVYLSYMFVYRQVKQTREDTVRGRVRTHHTHTHTYTHVCGNGNTNK